MEQEYQSNKGLVHLTTEIVLRATAKVCHGFKPWRIEAIAYPLAEALVDVVISQGNTARKVPPLKVQSFHVFELWNQILDEVQKEIPCVAQLEIIATNVTRQQRAAFYEGTWRKDTIDDPTTTDGNHP